MMWSPDSDQVMNFFNENLHEMEGELNTVDNLHVKGGRIKSKVTHMHEIYDEILALVEHYKESKQLNDFNHACQRLEMLKPSFALIYNELLEVPKE